MKMSKVLKILSIIGTIVLVALVFLGAYHYMNQSPFEEKEVYETLPPKETDEIVIRRENADKNQEELDFEISEPYHPEVVFIDENGNEQNVDSGGIIYDGEELEQPSESDWSETAPNMESMAEEYVKTPLDERGLTDEVEIINEEDETREITPEMHDEFQAEIDRKTQEDAQKLLEACMGEMEQAEKGE